MENAFSEEVAAEHVDRLVKFYRIYTEDLPKDLGKALKACLNALKRGVMDGRLSIEVEAKNITITQVLDDPQPGVPEQLVYGKIKARHKIGMKDDDTQYEKMYHLLGTMSGQGLEVVQKLEGIDVSLAESLALVFLQA